MATSRRQFLEITALSGGALLASITLPAVAAAATDRPAGPRLIPLGAFVRIHPDNSIVIGARGCEIGQGVRTSLPMLIAEELGARWDQVRVEQLDYGIAPGKEPGTFTAVYGAQGAGGSTSVSDCWEPLRQAGAQVRALLINAAAAKWQVPMSSLTARDAAVWNGSRSLTYGQLAASAAKLPLPAGPFEVKTKDFAVIGKPTRVADAADIVSGKARYGSDARLPGMVYAVIARCPYFDGSLKSCDDSAAKKIKGVIAVVPMAQPTPDNRMGQNLAAGVAVIAESTWAAMQASKALKIEWQPGAWATDSTRALEERCRAALAATENVKQGRGDGDMAAAWRNATTHIEADYRTPFLAHATMEPPGATVHITGDRVKLIASIQSPGGASRLIASMLNVSRLNVDIELPRSGGGFGRRLANDFVAEAVRVAQAAGGRPVKLLWTREDDLANDFYRPFGVQRLRAAADAKGNITGWSHRVAATTLKMSAEDAEWMGTLDIDNFPAGCIPNYQSDFVNVPFGLARGWWRAPLPTFAAFATQSFVDEVAVALKRDPLELRLQMLGESRELPYSDHGGPKFSTGRLAAVLREAARRIDYDRKRPQGRGVGLAVHFVFGGYTAHAIEVSGGASDWRIERCVCVSDIGTIVNPLGVEAQLMGATVDGISTASELQITVENGRVQQNNFGDYRLMRMPDAPRVEVYTMPSTLPPVGCGEMGIPSAAPALANAIYAASGVRLRDLPLRT
jgi:isoquinoline 1-oxidoreductase beta subunit